MEFSEGYLTYEEYKGLGGTLDQMPFNLLEFEARQNIDKYTIGRLKELPTQVEEVKLCDYKLITLLSSYKNLEEQDKVLSSESIDGYSYSYGKIDTGTIDAKNNLIKDTIRTYLIDCKLDDGTPYLYRGVK